MGVGPLKIEMDPLKLIFYALRGPKDSFSLVPSANPVLEMLKLISCAK